jgi:hypothetical protein
MISINAHYSRGLRSGAVQGRFAVETPALHLLSLQCSYYPTRYRLSVDWGGFPLVSSAIIRLSDSEVRDKPDQGARVDY